MLISSEYYPSNEYVSTALSLVSPADGLILHSGVRHVDKSALIPCLLSPLLSATLS